MSYLAFVLRNYSTRSTPVSGDLVSFLWRYFYLMSPGRYLMVSVHVLPSEKSETAPCPSLPRGGRMWLYLAWECSAGVLWFVIVQVFLLHYPAPSFEFTNFLMSSEFCPSQNGGHFQTLCLLWLWLFVCMFDWLVGWLVSWLIGERILIINSPGCT